MASPPPPYANVTGISRAVMKDSPQETFANYDGNARAGELVVNLDVNPPTLYIGNALGNLNQVTGGNGGSYGNSNVAAYLPTYTGNLTAQNIVVGGNITPNANVTYNLGNNTNRWNNLYLAGNTIVLGNAVLAANGTSVTVTTPDGGNFVLQGNSNTTFGNIVGINLDGNVSNVLSGNGTWIAAGGASTGNIVFSASQLQSNSSYNLLNLDDSGNVRLLTAGDNPLNIITNSGGANGGNSQTWTFGSDGLLTFPGTPRIDTDANNFEVQAAENINFEANAVVNIYTDSGNNAYQWQFGDDAILILADGNSTIQSIANSSLDPNNPNVSTMVLTPDPNFSTQVLVLDPTGPSHIHLRAYASSNIDEPAANIYLGGENTAFEVTAGANNQAIIHSGGNIWVFDNGGNLNSPNLNTARGDTSGGNLTGFTLRLGNGSQESIITTPDGVANIAPNSQRLVINPGKGADTTSGEGGDIYLWAGRGGDAGGSGGDVKIRGGYGPNSGAGGYIRMQGGDSQDSGTAGYIEIHGGDGGNTNGGYVSIQGGYGYNGTGGNVDIEGGYGAPDGGNVFIQGGQGSGAGFGGNVTISGGTASNGNSSYGNVTISTIIANWVFDNTGNLTFPSGNSIIYSTANSSLDPTNPNVSTMTLVPDPNFNSQVLVLDPTAPGHIHLRAFASSNIDEPAANIFLGGENTAFEVTSGANNQALIHSNNFTWTFGNDGVFTIPGNLVSTVASPAPTISGFSSISTLFSVTTPVPLANLVATAGARAFASDANLAASGNFGANVSNGGSNTVPVWSDGTNWYIG